MRSPGGVGTFVVGAALFLACAAAMPLPAQQPAAVRLLAPAAGETLAGPDVAVLLETEGVVLGGRASDGAYALLSLDGSPAVKSYSHRFTFRNVVAGEHSLRVELRRNDGAPFSPPAQATVRFRLGDGEPRPVAGDRPGG